MVDNTGHTPSSGGGRTDHARTIELLTDRRAPETMKAAAQMMIDFGSGNDPAGLTKTQVLGDEPTSINELAEDEEHRRAWPDRLRIWFYGEAGVQRGTVLTMLIDRIRLTQAGAPVVLKRRPVCEACGQPLLKRKYT